MLCSDSKFLNKLKAIFEKKDFYAYSHTRAAFLKVPVKRPSLNSPLCDIVPNRRASSSIADGFILDLITIIKKFHCKENS